MLKVEIEKDNELFDEFYVDSIKEFEEFFTTNGWVKGEAGSWSKDGFTALWVSLTHISTMDLATY